MKNPVVWFEIATKNLEKSKAFYAKVFNRNFELVEMPDMKMYMFEAGTDGANAGGALVESPDSKPSADGTVVYFECEDVALEAGKIEAAGGKLLFPKTSLGEFGFFSHFLDPDGNRIGLHSMK